jgi:Bacteriophage baseplate protein W
MSIEILVPFALDQNGKVATTADPDLQAMQHVESLVATYPGERVMLPAYGIPLRDYMFAPGVSAVTARINNDVNSAMGAWEPSLTVRSITPTADELEGVSDIKVDFTRGAANTSPVSTATVLVGGTVIDSEVPGGTA